MAIRALGLTLLWAATAQASTTFIDFNSDPVAAGLITSITGTGGEGGQWITTDGIGVATNSSDGYLQITAADTGQEGIAIFPDYDNGGIVTAFTFDCWVRIGNGTSIPADGFSIAYANSDDPVLTGGNFAEGPDGGLNEPEEGTTTGISVGFDTFASGGSAPWPPDQLTNIGPDIVGIDVRVAGMLILQYPMPTLNGSVTDPTSIQTGPYDGTGNPDILGWAHLIVSLNTSGELNIHYKGAQILTNYATGYVPAAPGQFVLAGRCGGLDENQDVDNITITTTIGDGVFSGAASGVPDGVQVLFYGSGGDLVDVTAPATVSIDGGPAVPASAVTTTVTTNSITTTLFYYSYPTLLVPGSSHTVVATVRDVSGRVTTSASQSFTVGAYSVVNSAWAVTGVTTADVGFRILPWQSGPAGGAPGSEPNNVWWADEQLRGLHGANNATPGTDNGYYDYTNVINFNITPASAGGADIGDFQSPNYPDMLFPGIPGTNGITDSSSMEAICYLQFQNPGFYAMGVNSDDGFDVTVGPNPADWGAQSLGAFGLGGTSSYDVGRGSSDTIFYFAVTNAGFYPFRLLWENGTGGANCEWFAVQPDGTKILINDPSPTNTTGIKAFYAGPLLPAYVSDLVPNPGTTGQRPDVFSARLTDLGTTVTATAGSISLALDGTLISGGVASKNNGVTTVTPPTGYVMSGGAHTAQLVYSTSGGGPFTNTWSFTVLPFAGALNASWAVTGVNTKDVGFRILPWQSGDQPNSVQYTLEQLAGWYGTNMANLSTATNNGYIDYTNVINFNLDPNLGPIGDFSANNGYPDSPFPGLQLTNAVGRNIADIGDESMSILAFLRFAQPGVYEMGVCSDDGFAVFAGLNPSDWFSAEVLGEFNGGRGFADTLFTFQVTNTAGFYPFRLIYENGNGSYASGNGANLEWFTVQPDGTKILLNDPSPTNTSGVRAFFSGLAPAYVAQYMPVPGATNVDPGSFVVQLIDGSTTVTSSSITVNVNGVTVPSIAQKSAGGITTVTLPAGRPLPGGSDTVQFVYSTSSGGPFTNTWNFTALPSFGALDARWAVTDVDTARRGFRIMPWQSGNQPNSVRYTQEQLAGLHGANDADLSSATNNGYIDWTGEINFNLSTNGQEGDFQAPNYPDQPFPGLDLTSNGGTVPDVGSESMQVLTFLQFAQVGTYLMGVNSDDGFAVMAGLNPSDWFAPVLGAYGLAGTASYDAGRGSSDTIFAFQVTNIAGFYPFQLLYENGAGALTNGNGASCEWFVVQPDGTKILLNDPSPTNTSGVAVFFSGPRLPAYVSEFFPAPDATDVLPNGLSVLLTDGSTTVNTTAGSISVTVNGTPIGVTASKNSGVTTVALAPGVLLPQGSDTAQLVYNTSGGGPFTNTWSFTVMQWASLNPAWAVTGVDTTKPGFLVRPWQSTGEVNASEPNDVLRWTEEQMVGAHGVNIADLSQATDNGYIDYASADVNHLINWNNQWTNSTSGQIGDFQGPNYPDSYFPGSDGAYYWNNAAEEVITYMHFSAPGLYEMGVNSDDGFSVKAGANPKDWLNATLCGDYEGTRGSSDTFFAIHVITAGYYPIRLLWENGGGGFNCEWFVVQADGTEILINDPSPTNTTGIAAYYSGPALPAYVSEFWPAPGSTGDPAGLVSVELTDGTTTVIQSSILLTLNGVAVTPVISHAGGVTKVSLPSAVAPGSSNTVIFSYSTGGGGPFTNTWSFVADTPSIVSLSTNLWTPPGSGSNSGFAMQVWQCEGSSFIFNGWDNIIRRADLGLQGLYGTNIASLVNQTNNGEMWWDGVINFAQNSSGAQENNGNFETADGVGQPDAALYTDSVVPGLPGPNAGAINGQGAGGAMDYDAWQARFFLEFPKPGPYTLGVDSDDCFQLTEGDQGSPGGSPLHIIAPASAAGDLSAIYTTTADPDGNNGFGVTPPTTVPIIAKAVLCNPPNANSSSSLLNASALAGNVAVVYHNGNFQTQARMAFAAGAIAVICGQTTSDAPLPGTRGAAGGGADPAIPCIDISYASYEQLTNSITQDTTSPVIVRITAQDCSPICGVYSSAGGRGASDTLFTVMVPQPGLYPFRLIWDNGGGDADCELFSVDDVTGHYVLVNSAASPIKAWITRNVDAPGALPAPKMNQPTLSDGNAIISWTGEGELWEAYSLDGPWFKSTYQSNPSAVVPSSVVTTHFFRVRQY
jgi:hypothetical protein